MTRSYYSVLANITDVDRELVASLLGGQLREPDLCIAPDGNPYLYRWDLIRHIEATAYLHLQVASDPERPLHDHPWDNQSVILRGAYNERMYEGYLPVSTSAFEARDAYWTKIVELNAHTIRREQGDVIHRKAEWPHRLFLPLHIPYTLTLFTTGPKRRQWGFWTADGWRHNADLITVAADGRELFAGALDK